MDELNTEKIINPEVTVEVEVKEATPEVPEEAKEEEVA